MTMPEDERVPSASEDLEDSVPWDGEASLPEWIDSDDSAIGGSPV